MTFSIPRVVEATTLVNDRSVGPLAQVITPSAGGPAERAGIAPKDVLLAIGDRPMEDISLYEAGDLLQGTEGTEVPATCPTWPLWDTVYNCHSLLAPCCLGLGLISWVRRGKGTTPTCFYAAGFTSWE